MIEKQNTYLGHRKCSVATGKSYGGIPDQPGPVREIGKEWEWQLSSNSSASMLAAAEIEKSSKILTLGIEHAA